MIAFSNQLSTQNGFTKSDVQNFLQKRCTPAILNVINCADVEFQHFLVQVLLEVHNADSEDELDLQSTKEMIIALLTGQATDSCPLDESDVESCVSEIVESMRILAPSKYRKRNEGLATSSIHKQETSADNMENVENEVSLNIDRSSMDLLNSSEVSNANKTRTKSNRVALRMERQKEKKSKVPPRKASSDEPKEEQSCPSKLDESRGLELFSDRRARLPNSVKGNMHLTRINLAMDNGNDLLQDATMDIMKGHRYGLVGRNGVGKSTLLRRLATLAIPGLPQDIRISFVQQQVNGSDTKTTLDALIDADLDRADLLREQNEIENKLCDVEQDELAELSQRLNDISAELDAIDADTIEERALEILKGLQFTDSMISNPTSKLSGGWRMRLAIAQSLIQIQRTDLLLLDECTNHLDLFGLHWLIEFLTGNSNINRTTSEPTIIVVSHDRTFLDAVCTDVIVMAHKRLTYHAGNYSDYLRQQHEKTTRETQILDASERQRTKAVEFVQKQQASANKKSSDPNKQRQAKMVKEKKLDRIGNYREDGKRYKQQSLKKLDESYIRLAQKVEIEVDDPIIEIRFPNPIWPPGVSSNDACPLVRMEDFSFAYSTKVARRKSQDGKVPSTSFPVEYLLDHITLELQRGSKVALVGKNGTGKTTLCKLISGELMVPSSMNAVNNKMGKLVKGEIWRHPNIRIGHITQYSVEELDVSYGDKTVLEYAEIIGLRSAKASASVVAKGSGNVRQYLGAFGLGGNRHANSPIRHLSGGEKMRLCFATVLADEPHLLLLDESTNHVDIETLESMSHALREYEGAVLMVSHNQAFLSGFCNELWVLDTKGYLTIHPSDTDTFDELFSQYRDNMFNQDTAGRALFDRRKEKAALARKAIQNKHASEKTAML